MDISAISQSGTISTGNNSPDLSREQITAIVFNETRSLSGDGIDEARKNIAHVILNHLLAGTSLPRMASSSANVPFSESAIYDSCAQAVNSAIGEAMRGLDPTGGATNFNFRSNESLSPFYEMPVHTHQGPLKNSFPTGTLPARNIFANTYGAVSGIK